MPSRILSLRAVAVHCEMDVRAPIGAA